LIPIAPAEKNGAITEETAARTVTAPAIGAATTFAANATGVI
jgi:hypothetical protein